MIDPNFWTSEDVGKLNMLERLLLIGMFSNADDYGKGRANPVYLRSTIFPYDDIPINEIESSLVNIAKYINVVFYEVDGSRYYKFIHWDKWQNVQKPQASKIPDPVENDSGMILESVENNSGLKEKEKENKEKENIKREDKDILSSPAADDCPSPDNDISQSNKQIPYQEIVELYNQTCISMPKVEKLTEKRRKAIKAIWAKNRGLDTFKQLFEKAETSDFLSGRSGKWTSCNFDWLMNTNNMLKVLEGTYDNRAAPNEAANIATGTELYPYRYV
jgi:hypothetical protein